MSKKAIFIIAAICIFGFAAGATTHADENEALRAISRSNISIQQAISIAEGKIRGRAVDAELDMEDGRPVYEIKVLDVKKNIHRVELDAVNGKILSTKIKDRKHFPKFKISMAQAVDAVQSRVGGTVVQAELDSEAGKPVYEVEIIAPDKTVHDVEVSAVSGKILSIEMDDDD
jgi:uncharacterized membrane protein YkoI